MPCDGKESGLSTFYGTDGNKMKWVSGSRHIKKGGEGRSPVIRFYWGYRSADHETDSPFQTSCKQLVSLFNKLTGCTLSH